MGPTTETPATLPTSTRLGFLGPHLARSRPSLLMRTGPIPYLLHRLEERFDGSLKASGKGRRFLESRRGCERGLRLGKLLEQLRLLRQPSGKIREPVTPVTPAGIKPPIVCLYGSRWEAIMPRSIRQFVIMAVAI